MTVSSKMRWKIRKAQVTASHETQIHGVNQNESKQLQFHPVLNSLTNKQTIKVSLKQYILSSHSKK